MDSLAINIVIVVEVIVAAGWIVVLLDRRSRKKRSTPGRGISPYTRQSLDDNNAAQLEMSNILQSSVEPSISTKNRIIQLTILYVTLLIGAILIVKTSVWAFENKGNPIADFADVGMDYLIILIPAVVWIVRLIYLRRRK